ncbi:hypothetical protein DUNSADRAFT_10625 [Dunaliella salina]|uniref:RAP domain-containing protein n=1 Tax=Dunaliella salina TaxID=3046 RepID=A0ABQ7GEZ8_DUNSA|nr:hypothetical protein DUNSADRAFT_10625 [Dunaliella salina]KAF5833177.1 hypothetical protein DUNSADRAFT_10625 [Dunaliella salina]|eukprot:KAF5833176.1 hypothetical protein DUNSADRAFT_10625 [Dunaliella salina]
MPSEKYRSLPSPFKKLTLSESLDMVEAAASPSPVATADMLISMGHALNREAKYRQLRSVEHTRVAAALAKLSDLLLEQQGSRKRIEQLDGKKLSLAAWAMGKVGSKGIQVSMRLGDAFAECACACPSMDGPEARGEGWRRWANLLYGLAEAGMVCSSSKHVHAVFDAAVNDRLLVEGQKCNGQDISNTFHATATAAYKGNLEPLVSAVAGDLRRVMKSATAQAWSNTIWAFAKHEEMKAGRLGQGVFVILNEGLTAIGSLAHSSSAAPQELSNLLWALPKLGWEGDMNTLGVLASALVMQAAKTNPQDIGNALWAFSELGWYESTTYGTLLSILQLEFGEANPQALSNAFLACAQAQHWDHHVEQLAKLISKQSVQQWGQCDAQTIANVLYSWAVLTAVGATPASPSFKGLAQQLFDQAARRGAPAFIDSGLTQLYVAHRVAMLVGSPGGGLSADHVLLQVCARSYEAQQVNIQKQLRRTATLEQELAAILQHAGYDVKKAVIVGGEFVQLLAEGVAVRVAAADDYFRAPPSLLKGSFAVHDVLASWVCKGSVVIPEAEWADLQGDPQQQQAFASQRLEQALSKA